MRAGLTQCVVWGAKRIAAVLCATCLFIAGGPEAYACADCTDESHCKWSTTAGYHFCAEQGGRGWRLCMYRDPCPVDPRNVVKVYGSLFSLDLQANMGGFPTKTWESGTTGLRGAIATLAGVSSGQVVLRGGYINVAVNDALPGAREQATASGGTGILFGGTRLATELFDMRVCVFNVQLQTQSTVATATLADGETLLAPVVFPNGAKFVLALRYDYSTIEEYVESGDNESLAFQADIDANLSGPSLVFAGTTAPSDCNP